MTSTEARERRPQAVEPIYTIGHGNRAFEELVALLEQNSVSCLVDVRAFPGSRRHPQFGRGELERSLPASGVRYVWEGEALGGRRRPRADSRHRALHNESFRAYADHMETSAFRDGIARLLDSAVRERVAIMCAERLPWQCHRFMIADFLTAHGVEVLHLVTPGVAPRRHRLRAEARVQGETLVYDVSAQDVLGLD